MRHFVCGWQYCFKMLILPKVIYRFNTVSIKIPAGLLFGQNLSMTLKCICKFKQSRIMREKNKAGGFISSYSVLLV